MPNSPLKLKPEDIFAKVNPRIEFEPNSNEPIQPVNIVNESFMTESEMKKYIPELQVPAVWLPHGILGISNSEIVKIPKGVFLSLIHI